jgi:hypothetical protein
MRMIKSATIGFSSLLCLTVALCPSSLPAAVPATGAPAKDAVAAARAARSE